MTNARYVAGRAAEYRARNILKARGHHTVIRAAGSHGPFDLVAIAPQWIRLVQVKRGRAISKAERTELVALKDQLPRFCSLEIWRFVYGKKRPDVEVL